MPALPDREKRRTIVCRTEQALKTWELGKARAINCTVTTPKEQVFYIPEEGPIVRFDLEIPDGILLSNQEVSVLCDSPGVGTYTVQAAEYQIGISYEDIPGITDIQLYHISTLDQESINSQLSDGDLSIIDTMRLTFPQQQYLKGQVEQALEDLGVVALGAATAMLRCVFPSDEQTHCCQNGTKIFEAGEDPKSCITFVAGYKFSQQSQESANQKVKNEADAILADCVIGNDEVLLWCNKEEIEHANNNNFGSSFVSKNTFFERTKESANAKAQALAEANLICLYCNDRIVINCITKAVEYPTNDIPCVPGQCVDVLSRNEICRENPQDLIEDIALAIANADECSFENREQKCSCAQEFPFAFHDYTEVEGNFNYSLVIPKGSFEAASQAEADTLAIEQCKSELECGWCSDALEQCEPFSIQGIGKSEKEFEFEYFTYAEALEAAKNSELGYNINNILATHPDPGLRGETPPSQRRPITGLKTGDIRKKIGLDNSYIPDAFTTDILAFEAEILRIANAGLELTDAQKFAIGTPNREWSRAKLDNNGRYIATGEKRQPTIPFCQVVSFVSKAAANQDLINQITANSTGETDTSDPCAAPCPEGLECKPVNTLNAEQGQDKGGICNIQRDINGKTIFSYCVKPDDGGGGGGGGGGEECPPESSCMGLALAARAFGLNGYEVVGECGKVPTPPGQPTQDKYCIKPKKQDPPPDGGTGGCPTGCSCIESPGVWEAENPGYTLVSCSGAEPCDLGPGFSPGSCWKMEKKKASGTLYWNDCDGGIGTPLITWVDGLITNTTDSSFTAGCPVTYTPPDTL